MPGRIDIALKWFDHGRGLELPQGSKQPGRQELTSLPRLPLLRR